MADIFLFSRQIASAVIVDIHMEFTEEALIQCLSGRRIGHPLYFFSELDSTNNVAFRLAMQGATEGTAVVADHQKEGKGRLSRKWQSPPGCNLYTSIVLKPSFHPTVAPQITLMTGVAVAEVMSQFCPGQVSLKWPNDVQIRGKKVCGILTEMKVSAEGRVEFIIGGIGINVNMKKEAFDESFRDISTSLLEETGNEVSRVDVIVHLYDRLEYFYSMLLEKGFDPIRIMWLDYADIVGKHLQVRFHDVVESGKVSGIDSDGALLLCDESNRIRKIMAGDASIIRS